MNVSQTAFRTLVAAKSAEGKLHTLKEATQGFESLFVKNMLKTMRSSIKTTQFGQTMGADTYKDMFDDAIANAVAQKSQFGVAKTLFDSASTQVLREALEAKGKMNSKDGTQTKS